MPKFMKRISKKAGLPPGTLVHVGDKNNVTCGLTSLLEIPQLFEKL